MMKRFLPLLLLGLTTLGACTLQNPTGEHPTPVIQERPQPPGREKIDLRQDFTPSTSGLCDRILASSSLEVVFPEVGERTFTPWHEDWGKKGPVVALECTAENVNPLEGLKVLFFQGEQVSPATTLWSNPLEEEGWEVLAKTQDDKATVLAYRNLGEVQAGEAEHFLEGLLARLP